MVLFKIKKIPFNAYLPLQNHIIQPKTNKLKKVLIFLKYKTLFTFLVAFLTVLPIYDRKILGTLINLAFLHIFIIAF